MKVNIYSKGECLIYESLNIQTIINYNCISSIIIYYIDDSIYKNRVDLYLESPVEYKLIKKSLLNRIVYFFFLNVRRDRLHVEIDDDAKNLKLLFKELEENLRLINSDINFDQSILWETFDSGFNFQKIKLLYSKNKKSLQEILDNHNRIIYQ
ncbi:hypothetical protein [Flavobacterium sp. LM4]|uniref:hypothetical protein n=1 Tax=Flavobacterium sp. LM4 TaxID=1938609 RepID=UPI000F4F8D93|nr:hypothetical protein [Flavobacterium sp. LM4]